MIILSYDIDSGRVVSIGTFRESQVGAQVQPGNWFVDISGIDAPDIDAVWVLHDVISPVIADRTAIAPAISKNPIDADNTDIATVSGLPYTCEVLHEGVAYPVTNGTFMFVADQPGTYSFTVDEPHYLYAEFTIDAA
jgi:hypothetical protein